MSLSSMRICSVWCWTTSTPASLAPSSATATRRGRTWSWPRKAKASGRSSTQSSEACSSTKCTSSQQTQKWLFSQLLQSGSTFLFSLNSVLIFSHIRYMRFWKGYHCRWNPKLRSQDSIHARLRFELFSISAFLLKICICICNWYLSLLGSCFRHAQLLHLRDQVQAKV